jgi:hypothetical protein
MSSGKKTKHIKVKFFFIKDRVDDGEIKVIDLPTKEMCADIMTKLLQGTAFQVMRAELMNCPVNYEDPAEEQDPKRKQQPISAPKTVTWKSIVATAFKTLQECVGQNRNCQNMLKMDRRFKRTKFPCGSQTRSMGAVQLPRTMWQVGVTDTTRPNQSERSRSSL